MNRRANFDVASFILDGKSVTVQTNKQTRTHKQTVNDISTPCLSACVNNNNSLLSHAGWQGMHVKHTIFIQQIMKYIAKLHFAAADLIKYITHQTFIYN